MIAADSLLIGLLLAHCMDQFAMSRRRRRFYIFQPHQADEAKSKVKLSCAIHESAIKSKVLGGKTTQCL